eukprot:109635-Amphidinium_carterae.2
MIIAGTVAVKKSRSSKYQIAIVALLVGGVPAPAVDVLEPILRNLNKLLCLSRPEELADICWACDYLVSNGDAEVSELKKAMLW